MLEYFAPYCLPFQTEAKEPFKKKNENRGSGNFASEKNSVLSGAHPGT